MQQTQDVSPWVHFVSKSLMSSKGWNQVWTTWAAALLCMKRLRGKLLKLRALTSPITHHFEYVMAIHVSCENDVCSSHNLAKQCSRMLPWQPDAVDEGWFWYRSYLEVCQNQPHHGEHVFSILDLQYRYNALVYLIQSPSRYLHPFPVAFTCARIIGS